MANTDVVYLPNDGELASFAVCSMAAVYITVKLNNETNKYEFESTYHKELRALYEHDSAFLEQVHDILHEYHHRANNAYHVAKDARLTVSPWLLEAIHKDRTLGPDREEARAALRALNIERWAAVERMRRDNVALMAYIWEMYARDFRTELGRAPRYD